MQAKLVPKTPQSEMEINSHFYIKSVAQKTFTGNFRIVNGWVFLKAS